MGWWLYYSRIKLTSAKVEVEVEVEAELGNKEFKEKIISNLFLSLFSVLTILILDIHNVFQTEHLLFQP